MSTNFYWIKNPESKESIHVHIGKRSAAGLFCWKCGIGQCKWSRDVHQGPGRMELGTFDTCPGCGNSFEIKATGWDHTAGVELGFAKSRNLSRTGIGTASSFTWTMLSHKWKLQSMITDDRKVIRDEYGDEYTAREFLEEELCNVAYENLLTDVFY